MLADGCVRRRGATCTRPAYATLPAAHQRQHPTLSGGGTPARVLIWPSDRGGGMGGESALSGGALDTAPRDLVGKNLTRLPLPPLPPHTREGLLQQLPPGLNTLFGSGTSRIAARSATLRVREGGRGEGGHVDRSHGGGSGAPAARARTVLLG